MTNKLMLLAATLICVGALAVGCASGQPSAPAEQTPEPPAQEPPTSDVMLDPEEAFDAALAWLRSSYPDKAPVTETSWVAEDVEVLGRHGEPLLGAAEKRISSDDWMAQESWAVVAPNYVVYYIILKSPSLGWYWEGTVKAMGGQVGEEVGMQEMTDQLATEIATQFVKSSPTYMYSGIGETLALVETSQADRPYSWVFVFEFESRHSGYGDTANQVVQLVGTPHRAAITVGQMEVVEATLDGRWDILAQEFIGVTEEGARQVADDFVRNSPTFVFDGIPETLELVDVKPLEVEGAWTVAVRFDSRQAGYGDRTGQMLAEVITPHEAVVVVRDAAVFSATMDGTWDMLAQKTL